MNFIGNINFKILSWFLLVSYTRVYKIYSIIQIKYILLKNVNNNIKIYNNNKKKKCFSK